MLGGAGPAMSHTPTPFCVFKEVNWTQHVFDKTEGRMNFTSKELFEG